MWRSDAALVADHELAWQDLAAYALQRPGKNATYSDYSAISTSSITIQRSCDTNAQQWFPFLLENLDSVMSGCAVPFLISNGILLLSCEGSRDGSLLCWHPAVNQGMVYDSFHHDRTLTWQQLNHSSPGLSSAGGLHIASIVMADHHRWVPACCKAPVIVYFAGPLLQPSAVALQQPQS